MQIEILAVCDRVNRMNMDKLSLMGITDAILVKGQLPTFHQNAWFVAKVRFALGEGTAHTYQIELSNPDGHILVSKTDKLPSQRFYEEGDTLGILTLDLVGFPIESKGRYSIKFRVDNSPFYELPIHVV